MIDSGQWYAYTKKNGTRVQMFVSEYQFVKICLNGIHRTQNTLALYCCSCFMPN